MILRILCVALATCVGCKMKEEIKSETESSVAASLVPPSCSEAVCYLALRYFGDDTPFERIVDTLEECGTQRRQTGSMLALKQALERLGIRCQAVKASFEELACSKQPMIMHCEPNPGVGHYVFCVPAKDQMLVFDPVKFDGRPAVLVENDFNLTGYALLLVEH